MKNLVLIGLSCSGKTTLGKFLAQKLKKNFYDSDFFVEQLSGQSIPALFAVGEKLFRDWETKALQELASKDGAVIATGGGAVLRQENMQALKQNGVVIFLNRNPKNILQNLPQDGSRPLLRGDNQKIFELYKQRLCLYQKYADYSIEDGNLDEMQEKLLQIAKEVWG